MATLFLDRQVRGEDFTISDHLSGYLTEFCRSTANRPQARRRSHLFVPLLRGDFMQKIARGEVPADNFIWDLEDSIPAAKKQAARECIAKLPPKPGNVEYSVRINGGDPKEVDRDIEAIARYPFDTVTLPKGESGAEIARMMKAIGDDKAYAVTIESARGIKAIDEIAQVLRPGRDALGYGVGDMSTDLGVERMSTYDNPMFQQILGTIAITARAYNLQLFDSVSAKFNDPECARKESELSCRCFGYTGKKLINPKQLDAINATFSPARAEIAGHLATLESFLGAATTNARVVASEYKGLPAFIASERQVKRYIRQGYLTLTPTAATIKPAVQRVTNGHAQGQLVQPTA